MIFSAMISDNYSKKKSPVGLRAHRGFFLTPHYQRTLCASFCANKNFAEVLVADLALQMGWNGPQKNISVSSVQRHYVQRTLIWDEDVAPQVFTIH